MTDCLFCKIITKEIPSKIVYADELVTAFRDINPQAPTHILIVPNQHIGGAGALEPEHTPALAAMFAAAKQLAESEGLLVNGYRMIINEGPDAGQTVLHLHLHLLGGRQMGWPPG
jgi:histidine triad (HIT) family protein